MQRRRDEDKTIWLPPAYRKEWETVLNEHREALKDMEIEEIAPLIRWAAKLGKAKLIRILENSERVKAEKE